LASVARKTKFFALILGVRFWRKFPLQHWNYTSRFSWHISVSLRK